MTDEADALLNVQGRCPDRVFGAEQQRRLAELMDLWRMARDRGTGLPAAEQAELDALIEAELNAAADRAAALRRELDS